MKWHNVCVVSLQKDKKRDKRGRRPGKSESHVSFSGEAFHFILFLCILKLIK